MPWKSHKNCCLFWRSHISSVLPLHCCNIPLFIILCCSDSSFFVHSSQPCFPLPSPTKYLASHFLHLHIVVDGLVAQQVTNPKTHKKRHNTLLSFYSNPNTHSLIPPHQTGLNFASPQQSEVRLAHRFGPIIVNLWVHGRLLESINLNLILF